jgi:replicative DNA helicase
MYKEEAQVEVMTLIGKHSLDNSLELSESILYLVAESVRHEHQELGGKLIEMSQADKYDPTDVLDVLQNHITSNKFKSLTKNKELTNEDLMDELDAQMERSRESKGVSGLRTGYTDYDTITAGMQPTNFIIVAARPAMGKTQWALGVMNNLSIVDDKKGAFFSCEMDETQLAKRLICINGNIKGYSIKYGNLSAGEKQAYRVSRKTFINSNAKLMAQSWNINDIVSRSHEMANTDGLDYIIVDYLQIVNANGNGNKNSEIEEITRKLKELANDLKIPVIALSQLSRAVEQRPDKKPMLSDLRDSGAIEQDADIVMFLYRPSYYMEEAERLGNPMEKDGYGIIAKHRDGEIKDILMKFEQDIPAWTNQHSFTPTPIVQDEIDFEDSPSAMQPNDDFDFIPNEEPPF